MGADDVLAPLLLARWAEAYDKRTGETAIDVAPLFESVDTLDRCGDVMRTLLAEPVYRRHLEARGRRQCVLIGYSDSNEADGPCASRFATHQAQRTLAGCSGRRRRKLRDLSRARRSIARGGGRVDALVRAAPVEALNGVLRFTEQGEADSAELRPAAHRHAHARARLQCAEHDDVGGAPGKDRIGSGGSSRSRRRRSPPRAARHIASSCMPSQSSTTISERSRPST